VQWLKILKEAVTPVALLFLVGFTLYTHVASPPAVPPVAPPSTAPDPVALKLGRDYAHALAHAASDTLEASASRSWTNTAQAAQQNLDDFDDRLSKAWKPVAAEFTHRFGPSSEQPVDFARAAEIRKFCRDLAAGARKEAAP
jgi:hypothetical protein